MTTIASHTPLQAAAADATARIRFVVVLEGAAGDEGPHLRTLRFVLKHLLRSRSLRCTSVTEVRLDPRDVRRADDGDGGTPSAQIVQLPRRDRGAIHVECVEGDWLVIYDEYAWPHSSREAAMREANEIAAQFNAVITVQAPR